MSPLLAALQKHRLAVAALAASLLAVRALWVFIRGWIYSLDRWDISQFVTWMMLALFGALMAALAAFLHERANRDDMIAGALAWLTRVLLAVTLSIVLFCNAGWVRSIYHFAGRQITMVGQARDLPPPPASR